MLYTSQGIVDLWWRPQHYGIFTVHQRRSTRICKRAPGAFLVEFTPSFFHWYIFNLAPWLCECCWVEQANSNSAIFFLNSDIIYVIFYEFQAELFWTSGQRFYLIYYPFFHSLSCINALKVCLFVENGFMIVWSFCINILTWCFCLILLHRAHV